MAKQIPLTCSGHTRPVVDVSFSGEGPNGFFLISACKGKKSGDYFPTHSVDSALTNIPEVEIVAFALCFTRHSSGLCYDKIPLG